VPNYYEHPEWQALVEALRTNDPKDYTQRLVMADWLDENGVGDRAEYVRTQIAQSRLSPPLPQLYGRRTEPSWEEIVGQRNKEKNDRRTRAQLGLRPDLTAGPLVRVYLHERTVLADLRGLTGKNVDVSWRIGSDLMRMSLFVRREFASEEHGGAYCVEGNFLWDDPDPDRAERGRLSARCTELLEDSDESWHHYQILDPRTYERGFLTTANLSEEGYAELDLIRRTEPFRKVVLDFVPKTEQKGHLWRLAGRGEWHANTSAYYLVHVLEAEFKGLEFELRLPPAETLPNPPVTPDPMVPCPTCGVEYFPASLDLDDDVGHRQRCPHCRNPIPSV
jgi:uncharacterized protein (TIGR02996 family)